MEETFIVVLHYKILVNCMENFFSLNDPIFGDTSTATLKHYLPTRMEVAM